MITKEEWILAEQGNDEIAYKEYCNEAGNFTAYFFKCLVPFFIIYLIFYKFAKYILFSKIILGLFAIFPLILCPFFVVAIMGLFNLPKNNWLKYCTFIHIVQYGLCIFQVYFFIKFVLLK